MISVAMAERTSPVHLPILVQVTAQPWQREQDCQTRTWNSYSFIQQVCVVLFATKMSLFCSFQCWTVFRGGGGVQVPQDPNLLHVSSQFAYENFSCRVVVKHQLSAKFAVWIQGDRRLDFGWRSSHMKRKTNDSRVKHLLSFEFPRVVELKKNSIKWFPTTSRFGSSMINKTIQVKYRFGRLFPIFSFCFSRCRNFVFAGLGSPAFEALLKIGNEMS